MSKTTIHIDVVNLVATNRQRNTAIVCANKSYEIKFNFDNAWDEYQDKTARFIWNGEYHDVDFTGDTCEVPEIRGASYVNVGVYVAGAIRTTTSAEILCHPSILCLGSTPSEDNDKDYCNEAREAAKDAETSARVAEETLAELSKMIEDGKLVGKDGITPHIGTNGNWFIGETDTGVQARLEQSVKLLADTRKGIVTLDAGIYAVKAIDTEGVPYFAPSLFHRYGSGAGTVLVEVFSGAQSFSLKLTKYNGPLVYFTEIDASECPVNIDSVHFVKLV